MPTASSLPERLLSEKSDAVALQQIKERGALPMIDRGDIRQAIDRCSNIWASLPGAGYGHRLSIRLTAWLQNSKKRAERSERLMYEQSHRDYLRSGYLHHRSPVRRAVNHYRDNAITHKAQRDKNARELKLANAAITDMQMRQRDVAALDAKYTGDIDAKAENDALRDDVAAGRRRLHIKAVCQSVREATTASGVDTQPPPTGRHRWTGLFHPQREADHAQKQLEGTQKYINEQCR